MPKFHKADAYGRVRDVLAMADYTSRRITETLGGQSLLSVSALNKPSWLRRLRGLSPYETLIRLFHLGEPTPEDAIGRAIKPMTIDEWVAGGLLGLRKPDGTIRPRVRLLPVLGNVFAADIAHLDGTKTPDDFVMPPGAMTLQLACAMINRRTRWALDLGTGCGALALAAAPNTQTVIATDKNPRAVGYAEFNAQLNEIDRIEFHTGDLFEPVEGRRFDLIVCNPPFVVSPERRLMFRDSGIRGDEFCRNLIHEAAGRLESNGFFQMTGNYAHRAGQPWREDLAKCFADLGCDVVVWSERTESIADYAMNWITSTESQDPNKVTEIFDRWMDYYESEGIEAVSYFIFTMRRRPGGENWTAIEEIPRQITGPCGDDVYRAFRLRDFLAEHPRAGLFRNVCFRLHPNARLEQQHAITSGGPVVVSTLLRMTGSLRFSMELAPNLVPLIAHCDGQQPLKEIVSEVAIRQGLEPQQALTAIVQVIRPLIERGVLLPVIEGDMV